MNYRQKVIVDIELHSVDGIRECFKNGISPNDLYRDKPLIYELISEYTRSPRFSDCVRVFVENGLSFEDTPLLSVLLNDYVSLSRQVKDNPAIIHNSYTLRCAYTPLSEVSLLHICAEFNQVECAKVLVNAGVDVNVRAAVDANGFGGQTPIFHTVNQNSNNSAEVMDFLLSELADLRITVPGLIWGHGYEWETLIPAVNPISYAMMGLLPQMHRSEVVISQTVTKLLKSAYGIDYVPGNVQCEYLRKAKT
jgi:hypothetical protein